jgi:type I restriction enzyme S subunit
VWLSIADLPTGLNSVVSDSKEYLSDQGAERGKIVRQGTLLVSFKLTLGRLAFAGCDLRTNEAIAALPIKDPGRIEKEYLYWYLTYFDWDKAAEGEDKVKGKTLNKAKLKELPVPLPTLEDQRRIVAALDEAFAAIAAATANAEKNLANARELSATFPAADSETSTRLSIAELLDRGWLIDHMDGNHGGDYPRKDEFVGAGVTYLSANCIRDGRVDFGRAKFLTGERAGKLRKGFAKNRDVLFAHNATVGPVALLQTDADFVVLGTSLTYYRCDEAFILPEYLESYLRSPAFVEQYSAVMRQSTRNQVPITKQREFWVDVPPIGVQRQLVAALSAFQDDGRTLAKLYQAKLDTLLALKQSLLHSAFSGELTEREPLAA